MPGRGSTGKPVWKMQENLVRGSKGEYGTGSRETRRQASSFDSYWVSYWASLGSRATTQSGE